MDPSQWSGQADPCVPQTNGPNGADRITRTSYDYLGDVTVIQRAVGTSLQQNYETYTWNISDGRRGQARHGGGCERQPDDRTPMAGPRSISSPSGAFRRRRRSDKVPLPTTRPMRMTRTATARACRKRDGVTITYAYDALNRVTQKTCADLGERGGRVQHLSTATTSVVIQLYARFGSATGRA